MSLPSSAPFDSSLDVGRRRQLLVGLMLSSGLVALDSTVLAAAIPSIAADLGGLALAPWLFTAYLLTQAVLIPVYGKLADRVGRKPLLLFGIGLFALASAGCGLAWSMPVLIGLRALQGVGAAGIQPIAQTIVGDTYTLRERAKVVGLLASAWATASILGPTLGGVLCEFASWRWIFILNLPICLLATITISRFSERRAAVHRGRMDYLGTALLTSGCALIILNLFEGGTSWPWFSPAGIGVPLVGLGLLAMFALVESRADDPLVPLWVFRRRTSLTSSLVSLGVGAIAFGLTLYVPLFVAKVLGSGPLLSGLALVGFMLGWPIGASSAGRLYLRVGFKRCAVLGASVVVVATGALTRIGTATTPALITFLCLVAGVGIGLASLPTLVAAQASVRWGERGVITGNVIFCRCMGAALGVSIFGAVARVSIEVAGSGVDGEASAFSAASQHVFAAVFLVAILLLAATSQMAKPDLRLADDARAPQP